jgi:pyruvate dehydrogenase E2 component (dihydrolipoamide acetyltransferase)
MAQPPRAGVRGTVEIVEPTKAEQAIARRAAETRATVPDLELSVEVEMDAAIHLGNVPATALVTKASALALKEQPRANAAYRDGRFELYSRVNIGLVIAEGHELLTATVFDADVKSLAQLTAEVQELEHRARELTPPERSGATFTLAPYGANGISRITPLIWGSHAAALAAGEVRQTAVVRDGSIVPGHVMTLVLACDHRILYGADAAGFLARIRQLLERADL